MLSEAASKAKRGLKVFGLLLAGLWSVTSDLTRGLSWKWKALDSILPALACGTAVAFGLFRQGARSLLSPLAGRLPWLDLPSRVLLAIAIALVLNAEAYTPIFPTSLPMRLAWLWPPAIYRVLVLTALWGTWAVIVLGQFHRPTETTLEQTRRLVTTITPIWAAVSLAIPLAGTLLYLRYRSPWHFIPAVAAIVAALGGGTFLVRTRGGISREVLLAAAVVTQLAFLLGYLAIRPTM